MMSKLNEKFKAINLKKLIRGLTFVFFIALIVLASIASWAFNKEFDFLKWFSNATLLIGIAVFGILMGESVGTDKQMEIVGGLFQNNLKEYNRIRDVIESISVYFTQFLFWFEKRELKDKKIKYLQNEGKIPLAELVYKYIRLEDLPELALHAIEKKDEKGQLIYIDQMNAEQIIAIKYVLEGKITINTPNASFYLDAFEGSKCKSLLEQGEQLDFNIKANKKFNRTFKIITVIIVSLIWSLMTVNEFMRGDDIGAWVNLVSRIAALFGGLLSGWLTSITDVKLKAAKLKNKTSVLGIFKSSFDNQIFIPLDENELAKKHYQDYINSVKVEDNIKKVEA